MSDHHDYFQHGQVKDQSYSDQCLTCQRDKLAALEAENKKLRAVVEAAIALREYLRIKADPLDPVSPLAGAFDAAISCLEAK